MDDLLDLSRIVHGKFTLRFEALDLRDPVRSAIEAFEEAAELKRLAPVARRCRPSRCRCGATAPGCSRSPAT